MKKLTWRRIHAFLLSVSMMVAILGHGCYAEADGTEGQRNGAVPLVIPQNLHEENGFIVWDEVEGAYGYTIQADKDGRTYTYKWYENKFEWSRFICDNIYESDFGDYVFKVCSFDESGAATPFSSPVSVSYKATFTMPTNVKISEENNQTLTWDEVEGAARYYIRVYTNDETHSLHRQTYTSHNSFFLSNLNLTPTGEYRITVQAMDRNYHVSEWTKELLVKIPDKLATPQNIRFDESGENIIWDEVEGADSYIVYTGQTYDCDFDNVNSRIIDTIPCEQPMLKNWKRYIAPWSVATWSAAGFVNDEKTHISVNAISNSNDIPSSDNSEDLVFEYAPSRDESITVPQIRLEDGYITWDKSENAFRYLCRIIRNGDVKFTGSYKAEYIRNFRIDKCPEGDYEIELCVMDEEGDYNSKVYPLTLNTAHDESVWVPKLYYKFEQVLWDYDRLRHPNTAGFWVRLRNQNDGTVIKLEKESSGYYYGLMDLDNGEYTIDACTLQYDIENYNYIYKLGKWSEHKDIEKLGNSLYDKENETTTEVETPPEAAGIPKDDRITSITINPAFNMKHKDDSNVELDLSKIKIKAKEIYDEEGLKRAEAALGETLKGNKKYNLLDLTLLYDGKDFSNGYDGLVKVIIPLPKGHRDKTFSCYRLTETGKELIPGEQTEDSYIIYLEHFSEYALVAAGPEAPHTHVYSTDWKSDATGHWKECSCKDKAEESLHTQDAGTVTKEPTKTETGLRTYKCSVCGYVMKTEVIAKLPVGEVTHTHLYSIDWKSDATGHWKECACKAKTLENAHIQDAGTVTKKPSKTETGLKTYKCSVCGYVMKTEVIAKLPLEEEPHTHVYSTDWKSDAAGHWKECSCKDKAEENAHTQDEGTVIKEPSKTEPGIKSYKCSICGYVMKTEEIAKLSSDEETPKNETTAVTKAQKRKNEMILNKKVSFKVTGDSLAVTWNELPSADGYDIYAALCDDDFKEITTSVGNEKKSATISNINDRKINGKKTYKVRVKAYRLLPNGKKQYLGTSAVMYAAGSLNKTTTNAKNISLKKKAYALKKGKSAQIRATVIKADTKKKLLSKKYGAKLSYISSDEAIAAITSTVKIKTKKSGKCIIYVRALNGICKKITVTVK